MRSVWRFIRRWWWTFLIGAAAVAGLFFYILSPRRRRGATPDPGEPPRRTFQERAKEEVERVRLEGEVEKARATAVADTRREELDLIEETGKTDPAEGRRQVAAWMARNL